MTEPDSVDPTAPVRALKPATIDSYIMIFRCFASALVHRGILPIEVWIGAEE